MAQLPKILDNRRNGKVVDELQQNLSKGTKLSVISAYFTIYAFAELKKELSRIDELRFIFTQPTFVKQGRELQREFLSSIIMRKASPVTSSR
jgi:hypothetical protein